MEKNKVKYLSLGICLIIIILLSGCESLDFNVQFISVVEATITATSQVNDNDSVTSFSPTVESPSYIKEEMIATATMELDREQTSDPTLSTNGVSSPIEDLTKPSSSVTPINTTIPGNGLSFCEQLSKDYKPGEDFKNYCDKKFDFALDYPSGWEIDRLEENDVTTNPLAYRQSLVFHDPDYNNFIRVYTWLMPESLNLDEVQQQHWAYASREFKRDYSSMQIAGKPAYGFINRYRQDFSGIMLFFEHGNFYTTIELKITTHKDLEANWQIAQSIQTPVTSPKDNVLSDELIEDSYRLIR